MRHALALAFLAIILCGCIRHEAPSPPPPAAPDHSYDLLVKGIAVYPETVYLGDNYTVRVFVQRHGQYSPSAYRVLVFDSGETIRDEVVHGPGLMHAFEFNYTDAAEPPRNIRAYVESADILHPEPPFSLSNNYMQRTVYPQPLGYYGSCPECMHWYYDSVSYVMRQAQAFNLTRQFTLNRAGLFLRSATNSPPSAPIVVEICRDNAGKPGEPIASSSIGGSGISREPGWHYAHFQDVQLPPGKYWLVARQESASSYGVQWARAEGNPYGEPYDTMVMDLNEWPDWDYKLFDFAFQLY